MTSLPKFNFFTALLNTLPGALSSSSSHVPVLTDHQKDIVYNLQSVNPKPWLITKTTFHDASLVDSEYQSRKVTEQLTKMEILSPEGEVSTEPMERPNFGKDIMSRLAIIPAIKIKMIIDFLFWWIEETQRLQNLFAARTELAELLKPGELSQEQREHYKLELDRINMRIALKPSARSAAIESEQPSLGRQHANNEEPPAYEQRPAR